jgi:hypothetical protein
MDELIIKSEQMNQKANEQEKLGYNLLGKMANVMTKPKQTKFKEIISQKDMKIIIDIF